MAENKKSFVIYTDWKKYLDGLDDRQAGKWIKWMFEYCNDKWKDKDSQIEYPKDAAVKMLCLVTKDILKRDLKKYENKVESIKRARESRKNNTDNDKEIGIENKNEINVENKNEINMETSGVNCNMLFVNSNNIKESNKEKTTRFITPTLEEIKNYCDERNNLVDPSRFYDFYQSKGWMVGKNKMKDWKAAVRNWEKDAGFRDSNNPIDLPNGGFDELE